MFISNFSFDGISIVKAIFLLFGFVGMLIAATKFYIKKDKAKIESKSFYKYSNKDVFQYRTPIYLFSLSISLILAALVFSWTTDVPDYPKIDLEEIEDNFIGQTHKKFEIIQKQKRKKKKVVNKKVDLTKIEIIDNDVVIKEPIQLPMEIDEEPIATNTFLPTKKKVIVKPILEKPEEINEDKVFNFAEQMPRFIDCGDLYSNKEKDACSNLALRKYLADEIIYPNIAISNGIEGTCVVSFVVEKDGSISNIKILRNPGAGIGKEATRIVKNMHAWIPGLQRNRAVRVKYNLPIKFELN